jgi:hypothetical protein
MNWQSVCWCSIEDHQPNPGEVVLAYAEGADRIYLAARPKYEDEYNEHWTICRDSDCSCVGTTAPITHWMGLPKVPK